MRILKSKHQNTQSNSLLDWKTCLDAHRKCLECSAIEGHLLSKIENTKCFTEKKIIVFHLWMSTWWPIVGPPALWGPLQLKPSCDYMLFTNKGWGLCPANLNLSCQPLLSVYTCNINQLQVKHCAIIISEETQATGFLGWSGRSWPSQN